MKKTSSLYFKVAPRKLSIIYAILVAICFFSLLYGWFPVLHSQAFIALLSIGLSVLLAYRYFLTKHFFVVLLYSVVLWINAFLGDGYTADKLIMDTLLMVMCSSMCFYLLNSDDQRTKKLIFSFVLLIIVVQTIPSLYLYLMGQDTIRSLLQMLYHSESEETDWNNLYRLGILSFDVTHSLPFLVPSMMMWLRTKGVSKLWKAFLIVSLCCILILSYIYDVTTVQLLVLFAFVTSFLIYPNQKKTNRQRLIIASIFVLPFVISTTLQDGVLRAVENVAEGELKQKAADARYGLTHDESTGDIAARSELYSLSLTTFFSSPITGTNDDTQLGGHSAIFDRMAAFGLIGIVPYLITLFMLITFCRSRMNETGQWYFVICTICFITLLMIKNMSRLEEWLMFIVVVPSVLTLNAETLVLKKERQ